MHVTLQSKLFHVVVGGGTSVKHLAKSLLHPNTLFCESAYFKM